MNKLILFLIIIISLPVSDLSGQTQINILNDSIWTYGLKGYPSEIPLTDKNYIFTGADGTPMTCIDKYTGKEIWKLNGPGYDRAYIHTIRDDQEGNIYFNGMRKNIYAVRKSDGTALWTHECQFDDDIFSNITIAESVLYINPAENNFLAISTAGKLLWKSQLPGVCFAYSIEDDQIYCQLKNGVYILDRESGKIQSKIIYDSVARMRFPFPPVSAENLLIVQRNDSIFCHDKNNKLKILWSLPGVNALVYENKSLYTYNDMTFQKVDIRNGKILWTLKGEFSWYLQPALYKSNLYLQTRHQFYIIDNMTGEVNFLSPFRFKSYTKPLIEDDKIYLGFGGKYLCTKNPVSK